MAVWGARVAISRHCLRQGHSDAEEQIQREMAKLSPRMPRARSGCVPDQAAARCVHGRLSHPATCAGSQAGNAAALRLGPLPAAEMVGIARLLDRGVAQPA